MEIEAYLEALASPAPTPGGGSAAALAGAAAAALVAMVARITYASPKHQQDHAVASRLADDADALRSALVIDRERDEAAYSSVIAAMTLPRNTDEEKAARAEAMQASLAAAAAVPLEAAHRILDVLLLARRALDLRNEHLESDIGCAAEFASAGLRACAYNVRINHKHLKNQSLVRAQAEELEDLEREAEAEVERVRAALRLGAKSAS